MASVTIDNLIELMKDLDLDVNPYKLNPEKGLPGQGVDSLDLANFIFGIEDKFSVTVSEEVTNTEFSLNDILQEINKSLS